MTSTMNIGLPVVAMARWMDTVALEPLVVVTMCVVVLIVVWVSVKARKSPNDLKLSDGGAWRGSCEGRTKDSIQATKKGGSK